MKPAVRQLLLRRGLSPILSVDFTYGAYSGVSGSPRVATDVLDGTTVGVYAEAAGTNFAYDSEMSTTGGPSGLPTFWSTNNSISGITATKVSQDATGATYRFQGTAGATGDYLLTMGSPTAIAAAAAEVWTASVDVQQVSSSGTTATGLFIIERDAVGTFVNMVKSARTFQTDVTFPEVQTKTIVAGPRVTMGVYFTATVGAAVDVTYKFKSPQLEKSAFPSSKIVTPSNNTASRLADALTIVPPSAGAHVLGAYPSTFIGTATLFQLDDGTNNNRITLRMNAYRLFCEVVKGGVQSSDTSLGRVLPLVLSKVAISVTSGSVVVSFNGKPEQTIALPAAFPAMTRGQLGAGNYGAWGGVIASYAQYGLLTGSKVRALATPSGLYDDFDRAAGPLGQPATGQRYVQAPAWPETVEASNKATIDASQFLVTADSGTGTTASYNCVDLGTLPSRFAAAVAFDAGTAGTGNATLIAEKRGLRKVADITDGAVHIGFLDQQCQVQGFPGGVFTVYGTFPYATACATDGATIYNFGWRLLGSGFTVLLPDGTMRRVVSAVLAAELGRFAVYESFWQGATAARAKFKAAAVY